MVNNATCDTFGMFGNENSQPCAREKDISREKSHHTDREIFTSTCKKPQKVPMR